MMLVFNAATIMKNKGEILTKINELLDAPDCVVRVQRELTPSQQQKNEKNVYVTGKRVTIIIVGSVK